MATDVQTIDVGQFISDARRIMTAHRVHHVPVVDADRLVGLISSTDIFALGHGEAPTTTHGAADFVDHRHQVSEVMQRGLVTIGAEQNIRKAAELLSTGSFHALPVVDAEGRLLGMVTSTDIARFVRDS
jgi:CBS domain-containing protein